MGLHTYLVRVNDEEDEQIRAVAEAEGVDHLEILHAALIEFMEKGKKGRLATGMQALLHKAPEERRPKRTKACEHPYSRRLHVPQGVLCDACGTYL